MQFMIPLLMQGQTSDFLTKYVWSQSSLGKLNFQDGFTAQRYRNNPEHQVKPIADVADLASPMLVKRLSIDDSLFDQGKWQLVCPSFTLVACLNSFGGIFVRVFSEVV